MDTQWAPKKHLFKLVSKNVIKNFRLKIFAFLDLSIYQWSACNFFCILDNWSLNLIITVFQIRPLCKALGRSPTSLGIMDWNFGLQCLISLKIILIVPSLSEKSEETCIWLSLVHSSIPFRQGYLVCNTLPKVLFLYNLFETLQFAIKHWYLTFLLWVHFCWFIFHLRSCIGPVYSIPE